MRKKRDILFLCQYFYPEYISSATLPYDTAKALVKAGFSVSVLCGYPNEYYQHEKVPIKDVHEGIKIKRLRYLQANRSNLLGRVINYFSFTFAVFLRLANLKSYKCIVVYSNPPVLPLIAAWANQLFKIKIIFVNYDIYPEIAYLTNSISEGGLIDRMMQFINRRIYKNVNKVVALSEEMKEYILQNRYPIEEEQVYVIPNWYENKPIKDISSSYLNSKFFNLKPDTNLIISYFGNMGICQDLETILGAIRSLKGEEGIKFVFAGHGNKMIKLKKTIYEEDLENCIVFDFLHGKDFQDALNISDIFLVSLLKDLTGLAVPSKTYSYMMARKPIIAIMGNDSDISRDLIENKAGFSVNPGEVKDLVEGIKKLKKNPQLRKEMGENIRKVFEEKYTVEKGTLKYVNMIRELLEVE